MSNELNLNDLGLGDNSQSAINEKMPRRGAEGRGQSRESRKSLSSMTQRVSLNVCRCTLNGR